MAGSFSSPNPMPLDVLDHDDGVIDDSTDRDVAAGVMTLV
jgi:hypothetical protein